ncbi:hypothetical protein [Pseudomonas guariconensis]|uniref:hypothetical protein n=1 Tax=Pseudomonas guariconensis TaxID=1288410 RepID=UPI0018A90067|nr:hypothetical protein [Pseudomonas guariconensis]MBF8720212.1 hypothetical protein [Pseudomonas guariconensis]
MASDEKELGTKVITAKDLVAAISPYHTAMARLGSSLISVTAALRESEDPSVKKHADEAWTRLDQFITQMELAAATLDRLMKHEGGDRE